MEPLGYLADEPFGQEAARVLCSIPGLFEVGRVYRRKDITTELKSAFGQYGGKQVPLIGKIAAVFKSWGRTDRPFKQVASGRYEFLGYGEQLDNLTHSPAPDAQGSSPLDSDSVMPDWEFGSGPYERLVSSAVPRVSRQSLADQDRAHRHRRLSEEGSGLLGEST